MIEPVSSETMICGAFILLINNFLADPPEKTEGTELSKSKNDTDHLPPPPYSDNFDLLQVSMNIDSLFDHEKKKFVPETCSDITWNGIMSLKQVPFY